MSLSFLPDHQTFLQNNHTSKCINICKRYVTFFVQTITGNEKWCLYVNVKNRKEWRSPNNREIPRGKPSTNSRKLMLLSDEIMKVSSTMIASKECNYHCQQIHRIQGANQGIKPERHY